MKQYLRFLLLATLTSVPVVSVVACGTTSLAGITDEDILNKAAGLMRTHTFGITELGLKDIGIPLDGTTYLSWDVNAKEKINQYYSNLVSNDTSSNWEYEKVAVTIRSNNPETSTEATYINKYGPLVEARIDLWVDLSFKELKASVPIVIKITNDTPEATPLLKIKAIKTYLQNYLDDANLVFEFNTLFKDGLTGADATYLYDQILGGLRPTLLPTNNNDKDAVIDVEGVGMQLKGPTDPATVIYNLDANPIKPAHADSEDPNKIIPASVNGSLQNLTLQINLGVSTAEINLNDLVTNANKQIKITQKFPDVGNQISRILSQGTDNLWFRDAKLPKDAQGNPLLPGEQTFNNYVGQESTPTKFSDTVQTELFNTIEGFYPPAKMGSWWAANAISFTNGATSKFVISSETPPKKDDDGTTHDGVTIGYFLVNIEFKADYATGDGNEILITISNLKINLSKIIPYVA